MDFVEEFPHQNLLPLMIYLLLTFYGNSNGKQSTS